MPGVTSPLGIAAYSGIPLTHRDHTKVVTFVTGHDVHGIDWSKVGQSETLVIFMGIFAIREIAARNHAAWALRRHARDRGSLGNAARSGNGDWHARDHRRSHRRRRDLKPPATVIIGEVVALHEKLNWFEKLPLFGRKIVVTRARGSGRRIVAIGLRALGADAIELPVISTRTARQIPRRSTAPSNNLASYDWLIFTSVNGVRFFLDRLDRSPHDLRSLRARICAIGPATRERSRICI